MRLRLAGEQTRVAASYVELALAGDKRRALATVLEPLRSGAVDLSDLYDEVLAPASARVGDLWHSGAITVADEHFATRLTEEAMAQARALMGEATRPREARIVLACPPDEQHELGIRMLGDVLDADGWEVHALGASTPTADLVAYVGKVAPAAVGLSCGTPLAIPGLLHAVEALRAADATLPVVVGGLAATRYPAIGVAAGATLVLERLAEARRRLPGLLPAGTSA